jgi:hypothetical protein
MVRVRRRELLTGRFRIVLRSKEDPIRLIQATLLGPHLFPL